MNKLLEKIIQFEKTFAEVHSTVATRDYGLLYFNTNNPTSYDSNHAIINNTAYLADAVSDIISFYKTIGITPRIYTLAENIDIVGDYLSLSGFNFNTENVTYFVQQIPQLIDAPVSLNIKQVREVDKSFLKLILSDKDNGEYNYIALKESMDKRDFFLFAGYLNNQVISIASIHSKNKLSRIDHVFTHKAHRNKGYCSQIINKITQYNITNLGSLVYLYASNPVAINLYKKAGFVEIRSMIYGNYWLAKKKT
jgi:GNAT superfamily N-acetyltransferase